MQVWRGEGDFLDLAEGRPGGLAALQPRRARGEVRPRLPPEARRHDLPARVRRGVKAAGRVAGLKARDPRVGALDHDASGLALLPPFGGPVEGRRCAPFGGLPVIFTRRHWDCRMHRHSQWASRPPGLRWRRGGQAARPLPSVRQESRHNPRAKLSTLFVAAGLAVAAVGRARPRRPTSPAPARPSPIPSTPSGLTPTRRRPASA